MKHYNICRQFFRLCIVILFHQHTVAAELEPLLDDALKGAHREQSNIQRDTFRHPKETLTFFGLQPYMTVVEIWPGRGWYTEILAPVMREEGKLYLAAFSTSADRTPEWRKRIQQAFEDKINLTPSVYDKAIITELSVPEKTQIAPPGSADMVLTFRNVHNWMKGDYAKQMFDVFAKTLKSGGVLGIVEHRAKPGTSVEDMIESGYVTEQHVITLAEQAGFIFESRTDINANSNDTTNHPAGVWTLPPTLRYCKTLKNEDEQAICNSKYIAIGESDRMTLKFRKE